MTDIHDNSGNAPTTESALNSAANSRREFPVKRLILIIIAVAAIGSFGLFIRSSLSRQATLTLKNGGYTYSFKFFTASSLVQLTDKSTAFKYTDSEIAGVKPTNDPIPTNCSQIGSRWTKAFTVKVDGTDYPVCTLDDGVYALFFTAAEHKQLFTIAFGAKQGSTIYPQLKTTFSSVKVSK